MKNRIGGRVFGRFSRSKTSVTTAAAATGTSAVVSQVSQSNNSAATSKNLRLASIDLRHYLETIDDDDSAPADVTSMSRWIEKTTNYSNSSYGDGALLTEANIPSSHHTLIDLAAINSKQVYGGSPSKLRLIEPGKFTPSGPKVNLPHDALLGTIKATSVQFFTVDLGNGRLTPVIVVAIRGTVPIRDWAVNLNHDGETETTTFLGTCHQGPYKAHAGFLESARQTVDSLSTALLQVLLDPHLSDLPTAPQLLLTGHSAGGAVASLLYAHIMAVGARDNPSTKSSLQSLNTKFSAIHLITFGAPPVTSPPILFQSQMPNLFDTRPGRVGIRGLHQAAFYAIVNEGDPIPRADEGYIGALLRVFVSVGQPKPGPPPALSLSSRLTAVSLEERLVCELPKMELKNAGKVVLVRHRRGNPAGTHNVQFWLVPQDGEDGCLEKMLFGNPKMHPMREYLERLGLAHGKTA